MEFSTYEEFANRKKFAASECIKHIFLLEGSLYVPVSGLCLSASNSAFSSCFGMPEWNSTLPLGSGNRGLWRREGSALSCQPVSVSTYTQMCYLHTSQLNPPATAPGLETQSHTSRQHSDLECWSQIHEAPLPTLPAQGRH